MKDYAKRQKELEREFQKVVGMMSASKLSFKDIIGKTKPRRLVRAATWLTSIAAAGTIGFYGVDYYNQQPTTKVSVEFKENAHKALPVLDTPPAYAAAIPIEAKPTISEQTLRQYVDRWKTAWERNTGYADLYSPDFRSDRGERLPVYLSRKEGYKRERGDTIKVIVDGISVTRNEDGIACVQFRQQYLSSKYSDQGTKELCMSVRNGELDRIVSETWRRQ